MKSRLNIVVLTVEIAAIALLHAVKLNYSEKNNHVISSSSISPKPDFHAERVYTLSSLR